MAAYNPWYCDTYETILGMAAWSNLSEDIERKIVCIFSWMPRTIMSVPHPGKQFKCHCYSPQNLRDRLAPLQEEFNRIREQRLMDFDIARNRDILERLCEALFPVLGSVAASKFLHFSAPTLLPMWDSDIRKSRGHEDTAAGYIAYMTDFKDKLTVAENRNEALLKHPNIVRGWDIVGMERR